MVMVPGDDEVDNWKDWRDEYKKAVEKITGDYECQQCGYRSNPDDYQSHTLNWCEGCEQVTRQERLDE